MKSKFITGIAVGLSLFAGVLYVLGGLRDIFAPGFFRGRAKIPGQGHILLQFFLAATFIAIALLLRKTQTQGRR